MTCDERQDLFLLDAIAALPPTEEVELRAHIASGCPACAGAAAEATAIATAIPLALSASQSPNPATLQTLLKRVRDERTSSSRMSIRPPRRFFPVAIAAALAALLTAGAMWQWLGESHRVLTTPDLQFVSLAGSTPQPEAHGHVFWDKTHSTWLVYFFDLKPPAAGKEYELWFITADSQKLAGGTFNVDEHGNGKLATKLPPGAGQLVAIAITDERLGGVSSPQGSIQLIGKVQ